MPVVLDANIVVSWFVGTPSKVAKEALAALATDSAVVPPLWRWEVQDVMRRLRRGGHLTIPISDVLNELLQLPISVDDGLAGLFGDELKVSAQHGLSVYDAAYLELAMREGIALATNDKQLAAAAKHVGVAFPRKGER